MRVLHVESGMHLYGGAKQVVFITQGLSKKGVENLLVCPEGSGIAGAAKGHAEVIECKMRGDLDIPFVFKLMGIIKDKKPDIVHLHSRRGADILGGIAAKLSGVPCILSRRVDNPENRVAVALKYRLFDRIITISQGIKEVLVSEGVEPSKIRCVRSAVDTGSYEREYDKGAFRREFGFEEDSFVIGVIAQLIERKGHRFLLNIAPKLLKRHPNLKILFFGKGPLRDELEKQIEKRGLLESVYLAGFRDDMSEIIGCLDMVVHPALMEGLGVSLLQASSAGVPIVAFRAGGIPEAVREGVNGFLVEPKDEEALFLKIDALLEDKALRAKISENARKFAKEEFGIDAMVEGNLAVYREILTQEGKR